MKWTGASSNTSTSYQFQDCSQHSGHWLQCQLWLRDLKLELESTVMKLNIPLFTIWQSGIYKHVNQCKCFSWPSDPVLFLCSELHPSEELQMLIVLGLKEDSICVFFAYVLWNHVLLGFFLPVISVFVLFLYCLYLNLTHSHHNHWRLLMSLI